MTDAPPLSEPFGPWVLEEHLATGGTADVYVARPAAATGASSNERVVIKRLLPFLKTDPSARTIFSREEALYRWVRHPNVVACRGAGTVNDEPYLAMELVVGADLAAVLRAARNRNRSIAVPVAIHVGLQILAALEAVHSAVDDEGHPLGILHRDVTPSNVFLSEAGEVKLGDFGIARTQKSLHTPLGVGIRGKYAYLAPEQLAGDPVDARADVFAATSVTCEIFLGKRLFDGSGPLAVLLAVRDARIDNLEKFAPSLPSGLMGVLRRALAHHTVDRYPDAASLARALAPFAASPQEGRAGVAELVAIARDRETSSVVVAPPSMFPPPMAPDPAPLVLEWSDSALKPMSDGRTARFTPNPSRVRTVDGRELGPFAYAELIELVLAGHLGAEDRVDFMGTGWVPLREIEDLARYLANREDDTVRIDRPASPDWFGLVAQEVDASTGAVVEPGVALALAWIAARAATGMLLVEGTRRRREIYVRDGSVLHVSSTEPTAIGEYMVARGMLERADLDTAIAAIPRLHGHITNVLVGLGLVQPQVMIAAIEAQVRDQIVNVFGWHEGTIGFYAGAAPGPIDQPLAMPVGPIVEAGVRACLDDARATTLHAADLDRTLTATHAPPPLLAAGWSPLVRRAVELAAAPATLRRMLDTLGSVATIGDAMRAIEVARLVCLIEWT